MYDLGAKYEQKTIFLPAQCILESLAISEVCRAAQVATVTHIQAHPQDVMHLVDRLTIGRKASCLSKARCAELSSNVMRG